MNSETSKACTEITTPIKLTPYHISVACMAYDSKTNLLAGSKVYIPFSYKVGGAGASVSVWKMSDRPPYCELVRSTTMPQKQGYLAFVSAARKADTSIIRKVGL